MPDGSIASVRTARIGGHIRAAEASLEDSQIVLIHVIVAVQSGIQPAWILLRDRPARREQTIRARPSEAASDDRTEPRTGLSDCRDERLAARVYWV
jgi:hypothetical protein